MNTNKKWALLILIAMMSLKSFSQNVTDTTLIPLQKNIVRLVIKDLISKDGLEQEIIVINEKFQILEKKLVLKDEIIFTQNEKIINFQNMLDIRKTQLTLSQELSRKLQLDLKKQKFKTKLFSGIGIAAIAATVIILK